MPSDRDIKLRLNQQLNKKADEKPRYRSVICAADGSRTTGDMWADENNKIVWHQLFGSGGIGRAKCAIITPELNLGVEVSQIDNRLAEWEVVGDDPFLRRTATDNRNYQTIAPTDLQPGGRLMLWVDSRQIEPLATWDTAGTLLVNVTTGDYPYLGARKSFAGQNGIDLAASVPGAGLTRYVGLYLDAANALQTINGATTTIGLTPAEPTWPAGAFRLSVVQLDNGQTSIDFANDIFDKRMPWSDEQAGTGGGGWPFDNVRTVSQTDANADHATIAAAITAASAGDVILLDAETFTVTATLTVNKAITIIGHPGGTIVTTSTNSLAVFTITTADAQLRNMTISNSGAGTGSTCVTWNVNNVILEGLTCTKTGNPTLNRALHQYGGTGAKVLNSEISCSGGTTNVAYYTDIAATSIEFRDCKLDGNTWDIYEDHPSTVITLNSTVLANGRERHTGILNWMPEAKITKNLLYDSLMFDSAWVEGVTFNDIADDTYIGLWNVLHNGQAPDITRSTGGSTDPFDYYLTCTFDSAASQVGFVEFLKASDTKKLRGKTVSLSFDAWGTDVVEVRAAVIVWGSTADALTSDVVGTWATNNPTLATNWTYANTPGADITIGSTRLRYTVNNITIPATANNIAVFIWTSAEEASGDVLNLGRVQLEEGPVATEFVGRIDSDELALVQHFLTRFTQDGGAFTRYAFGRCSSTTEATLVAFCPVEMRTAPTMTKSATGDFKTTNTGAAVSTLTLNTGTKKAQSLAITVASGLAANDAVELYSDVSTAWIQFDARL